MKLQGHPKFGNAGKQKSKRTNPGVVHSDREAAVASEDLSSLRKCRWKDGDSAKQHGSGRTWAVSNSFFGTEMPPHLLCWKQVGLVSQQTGLIICWSANWFLQIFSSLKKKKIQGNIEACGCRVLYSKVAAVNPYQLWWGQAFFPSTLWDIKVCCWHLCLMLLSQTTASALLITKEIVA